MIAESASQGVSDGFKKELEINGVGYRAAGAGQDPEARHSATAHDVDFAIPEGIDDQVRRNQPRSRSTGIDQQLVGETAAKIREWRRPEPFKGKGIKYKDEYIFRKEGKKK